MASSRPPSGSFFGKERLAALDFRARREATPGQRIGQRARLIREAQLPPDGGRGSGHCRRDEERQDARGFREVIKRRAQRVAAGGVLGLGPRLPLLDVSVRAADEFPNALQRAAELKFAHAGVHVAEQGRRSLRPARPRGSAPGSGMTPPK